jgi:DNA-binding MarR family transcriptional regulator
MDIVEEHVERGFDCVCGNLRMATRSVTSVYDRHLRPAGLRSTQMAVLWAVARMAPSHVKAIARVIAMDQTALLRNLAILQRRGWVAIEVGDDRRERVVSLTPAGREVFAVALPCWQAAQAQVAKIMADSGVAALNGQLLRISRSLR